MVLRQYLYIDEDFVNDAFAMINGFDYSQKTVMQEDSAVITDSSDPSIQRESNEKTGSQFNASMPVTSRLQTVIDYLNRDEEIPFFDEMEKDNLSSIKRESFFEGCFKFSFTKIETYGQLAKSVQQLDNLLGTHQVDGVEAIVQMQELAKQEREKGIPCVLTFANEKEPVAYAFLNEKYFRVDRRLVSAEVTILCKVVRKIKKGDSICLTDLSELMNLKYPNTPQGKKAKVEDIKNGKLAKIKEFEDRIKGPAIEIIPIAIYR